MWYCLYLFNIFEMNYLDKNASLVRYTDRSKIQVRNKQW